MATDVAGFIACDCAADCVPLPGGLVHRPSWCHRCQVRGAVVLTGRAISVPFRARRRALARPYAVSLLDAHSKEKLMDVAAKLTSKGQVTLPKVVREALGLHEGDQVLFRVEGDRAVLARTGDLLDLADTVSVPASKRGTPWEEVRRQV